MKCRVCKRNLGPKHAAAGIGPTCAKREKAAGGSAGSRPKITFLSSPRTTARDRRTWLYRTEGEPSYMVRVYPDPEGDGRTGTCDCPTGRAAERCVHVDEVGRADAGKFLKVEVKK